MTARITFTRGGGWSDRWRAYQLFVNEEQVGMIKAKSQLIVDVPPGHHVVTARIDWCRGNDLTLKLADGDDIEIAVSNRHGAAKSLQAITTKTDSYLALVVTRGLDPGPWG